MKRTLLLFAFLFISTIASAQFTGGFGCGDPNAWFDKEIYFWCQNKASNGYYGLNLQNISIVIDNKTQIDFDGVWVYGDYIFLGKDDGCNFDKGSTVSLYVNGYYQHTWTCLTSNPTTTDVIKRLWDNKPKGRIKSNIGKNVLKILRKIKK